MRRWIQFVIRRRRLVLALAALVTICLVSQLRHLELIIDPDNILPQEHPFVKANETIEKTFGNKFTVVITLAPKQGDIYQTDFLELVKNFTLDVYQLPNVIKSHVNGIATDNAKVLKMTRFGPVPSLLMAEVPKTSEDLESFKTDLHSDPVFEKLLISSDKKTTQVIAEFSKADGGFENIKSNVENLLHKYRAENVELKASGLPLFLAELEVISRRMGLLFPLAILIIGLIHYEAFRTLQALILPLVTALLAVVWAVGLLGLMRQSFDVFNASTPILILAIAAGHAVQILKRYYEEFAKLKFHFAGGQEERNWQAIENAMVAVGPVMIVACIVAALGFFSLVIFEIKTVRTFGLFTGFGVLSALTIELSFIPALRAVLKPPTQVEESRESTVTIWERLIQMLLRRVQSQRRQIYTVFGLVMLAFVGGSFLLKVDNSQKGYFADSLQIKKDDHAVNEKMAGTNLIYFMLTSDEGSVVDSENLRKIDELQALLDTDPQVGKTISINNFVKRVNKAINGENADSYLLPGPDELSFLTEKLFSDGSDRFSNFLSSDKKQTIVAVFIKTDSSEYIETLSRKVNDFAQMKFLGSGLKVEIGGGAVNGVALNEVLIHEKILNIAQILLAVFLVTSLVFRSVAAGALISVPLIVAVIANFGIMGLLGIPLQIATALVSAMAVGIGADYGIYMSYRIREELAKTGQEDEAFRKAYLSAGKATLFVSSAVAGGFGVLMLSYGFYIHIWMGFLIMTAMLTSSLAALVLFPSLLLSLRPKFIFRN